MNSGAAKALCKVFAFGWICCGMMLYAEAQPATMPYDSKDVVLKGVALPEKYSEEPADEKKSLSPGIGPSLAKYRGANLL